MFLIMDNAYRFLRGFGKWAEWTKDQNAAKDFRTENAAIVWLNKNAPHLRQQTVIVPKDGREGG